MQSTSSQEKLDIDRSPRTAVDPCAGGAIPFTRVSTLTPFVSLLNSIGAPTGRLLRQAHIPALALDDTEALVPVYSAYRFAELAARQEHLEDLGMVVGQRTSSFELGSYGAALHGVATVHEYLQTGIRLMGALSSGTRLWLTADNEVVRVNQYLKGPIGLGRCIADVYTLTVTISTLRRFLGAGWCPEEIRLLAGSEELLGNRDVYGDGRLLAGQQHTSFTISRALLERTVRSADTAVALTDGAMPMASRRIPVDFISSIERLIESLVDDGWPAVHTAAEAAGMSSRTLQRRLAEAGFTYGGLVTASRMRLARDWLTGSDIPVVEIAAVLGYADASNFARAFRRETGISPRAFRQKASG